MFQSGIHGRHGQQVAVRAEPLSLAASGNGEFVRAAPAALTGARAHDGHGTWDLGPYPSPALAGHSERLSRASDDAWQAWRMTNG